MTIESTYENIAAAFRGLCTLESIPALIEEATEEKVHVRATLIRDGATQRELTEAREKLVNWELWANGIIDEFNVPVNRGNVFDNVRESVAMYVANHSNEELAYRKLASTLDRSSYDWREWATSLLREFNLPASDGNNAVQARISKLICKLNDRAENRDHTID